VLAQGISGADFDERLTPTTVEHCEPKWQIVEQLVGNHYPTKLLVGHLGSRLDTAGVALALDCRHLDRDVTPRPFGGGVQDRACQRARSGTDLDDAKVGRLPESIELGGDPASYYGTEERTNLRRSEEIAASTGTTGDRVETVFAVERLCDVVVEAQQFVQGKLA